jgi:hypothetical protein
LILDGAEDGLEVFNLEAPVIPGQKLSRASWEKMSQHARGGGHFSTQNAEEYSAVGRYRRG